MSLWLRTYVWTLFYELLTAALSVLVGIGMTTIAVSLIDQKTWLVLLLGLLASLIALTGWWHYASPYVSEPDPVLDDPRPFGARVSADLTTALLGIGIVTICVAQMNTTGEPQARWALLATILGGPFTALGLGTAWERWNKRTLG